MFIDNKYKNWYFKLIEFRKNNIPEGYSEKHHIIPKSLGGNNSKENLVKLTAREHFVCHRMLVFMTSGRDRFKMMSAVAKFMQNSKNQKRNLTSKQYEICRKYASECAKEFKKGIKRKKCSIQKGIQTCFEKYGGGSARVGKKMSFDGKEKISLKRKERNTYEKWFSNANPEKIKQKHSLWAKQNSNFIYNNPSKTEEGKRSISLAKSQNKIQTPFGIFDCKYDFDLHPLCSKIGFENIFYIKNSTKNIIKTRAINRANLPKEWKGKTWEEVGFKLLSV
jgi:hypothetical protein